MRVLQLGKNEKGFEYKINYMKMCKVAKRVVLGAVK